MWPELPLARRAAVAFTWIWKQNLGYLSQPAELERGEVPQGPVLELGSKEWRSRSQDHTPHHQHLWKPWFPMPRGCVQLLQSCPPLYDPMACSPPGSSVYGISQARIRSGLPSPSLGDLPDLGIEPKSPALAGGFLTTNATWEALPIFRPSSSISALSGISFSVYSLSFIAFCSSEASLSPCGLTLPENFSESEWRGWRSALDLWPPRRAAVAGAGWEDRWLSSGHTGCLQSRCSQRPARWPHCSGSHSVPQTEAPLFPGCLVLMLLGEGDRRKHWGALRSGAGSESSYHTDSSNQVSP